MKRSELREGDVLTYSPASDHCREGVAIVVDLRRGLMGAHDTYWGDARAWLDDAELETAVVAFNVQDYTRTTSKEQWLRFAPADRATITRQHGKQAELYIRTGAEPDLNSEIANAADALRQAQLDVTAAQSRLRRAQAHMDELTARLPA